jgi:hypothetical protein
MITKRIIETSHIAGGIEQKTPARPKTFANNIIVANSRSALPMTV